MENLFILGADDPEMTAIEALLRKEGYDVRYALNQDGSRVTPPTAYTAAGFTTYPDDDLTCRPCIEKSVLVECGFPGIEPAGRCDHHRPGDSGYGKSPAEYWEASSIGQVAALLDGNHGHDLLTGDGRQELMMVAAADHCLAAAYAGQCPGIEPAALAAWRAHQIARFKKVERDEVFRRVAETRRLIEAAPRIGFTMVADLRAVKTDDGQILAEAGCQAGIAYLATVTERDGRQKVILGGAGEGTVPGTAPVEAFLEGWGEEMGLTGLYGDPARGFAGGYLPQD